MFGYKYKKYKTKYLQQKRIEKEENNLMFGNRPFDMDLFMDLYQVSNEIKSFVDKSSIILLIGDTPSYLKPFLENDYQVYNMAFSNKPFGCFFPPYSDPIYLKNTELDSGEHEMTLSIHPNKSRLNKYFNYLDTKTILKRSFIKQNWNKIILIDSSTGASITGVSIFLNRYISNIKEESDEINCVNISGCKPLKFIRLTERDRSNTNLMPDIAKKMELKSINFRPDLIIYIGSIVFYHRSYFMIAEAYPRYVPFYAIFDWHEWPDDDEIAKNEIIILNPIREIYRLYIRFKSGDESVLTALYDASIKYANLQPDITIDKFPQQLLKYYYNILIIKFDYSIYNP